MLSNNQQYQAIESIRIALTSYVDTMLTTSMSQDGRSRAWLGRDRVRQTEPTGLRPDFGPIGWTSPSELRSGGRAIYIFWTCRSSFIKVSTGPDRSPYQHIVFRHGSRTEQSSPTWEGHEQEWTRTKFFCSRTNVTHKCDWSHAIYM